MITNNVINLCDYIYVSQFARAQSILLEDVSNTHTIKKIPLTMSQTGRIGVTNQKITQTSWPVLLTQHIDH